MPWWSLAAPASAATLSNALDTLSVTKVAATSSHTIALDLSDSSPIQIQEVSFQFATTAVGSTKPAGLSLTSATLGTLSVNLGSGWTLDTGNASAGLLTASNASPVTLGTTASLSFVLNAITNQTDINICEIHNGTLSDTCYVNITAYSDLGTTAIGTGSAAYVVIQDPALDFQILPVSAGVTTNGITTDYASTEGSVSFGSLSPDQVHYVSQQIHIATNAPHGYTVSVFLDDPISGKAHSVNVSPFGATDATWTTPQAWMDPTGASPGSNSGWLAANTNDTRVSGWSGSTSGKFGPVSTTKRAIAHSDGPDSGTTVTVSYAFGVSIHQPADVYTGNLHYEIDVAY